MKLEPERGSNAHRPRYVYSGLILPLRLARFSAHWWRLYAGREQIENCSVRPDQRSIFLMKILFIYPWLLWPPFQPVAASFSDVSRWGANSDLYEARVTYAKL